jgi:hypothetical protein
VSMGTIMVSVWRCRFGSRILMAGDELFAEVGRRGRKAPDGFAPSCDVEDGPVRSRPAIVDHRSKWSRAMC